MPSCNIQDAALGALLTTTVIEHRRDLSRTQQALSLRGTDISLNALQRWYYSHFARDTETISLSTAMYAEMETDDGLDDHCAICQQRGLLLACDACSAVYHLSCVGLKEVPDGEWKCHLCLHPPPAHGAHGARSLAPPTVGSVASVSIGGLAPPGMGRGPAISVAPPQRPPAPRATPAATASASVAAIPAVASVTASVSALPAAPMATQLVDASVLSGMPIKELKALLQTKGVSSDGALEKADLIALLLDQAPQARQQQAPLTATVLPSASVSAAPAPAAASNGGAKGQNAKRRRKEGADATAAKRIFRTAEGRAYEQDAATGTVTWCDGDASTTASTSGAATAAAGAASGAASGGAGAGRASRAKSKA